MKIRKYIVMILLFVWLALGTKVSAQNQSGPFWLRDLSKVWERSDSTEWNFYGSINLSDSELNTIDSIVVRLKTANGNFIRMAFKYNKITSGSSRFKYYFVIPSAQTINYSGYDVAFKYKNGSISNFYTSLLKFRINKFGNDTDVGKSRGMSQYLSI